MIDVYALAEQNRPVGILNEIEKMGVQQLQKMAKDCVYDVLIIIRSIGYEGRVYADSKKTDELLSIIVRLAELTHNLPHVWGNIESQEYVRQEVSNVLEFLYVIRQRKLLSCGSYAVSVFENLTGFQPVFKEGEYGK